MRLNRLIFIGFALAGCAAVSKTGLDGEQRGTDLRVARVGERWEVTCWLHTRAPEDQTMEARLRWRDAGGREWQLLKTAPAHQPPRAKESYLLPIEVRRDDVVAMDMICRDEQGRETFRRTVALVVPPEKSRSNVEPIFEGY